MRLFMSSNSNPYFSICNVSPVTYSTNISTNKNKVSLIINQCRVSFQPTFVVSLCLWANGRPFLRALFEEQEVSTDHTPANQSQTGNDFITSYVLLALEPDEYARWSKIRHISERNWNYLRPNAPMLPFGITCTIWQLVSPIPNARWDYYGSMELTMFSLCDVHTSHLLQYITLNNVAKGTFRGT